MTSQTKQSTDAATQDINATLDRLDRYSFPVWASPDAHALAEAVAARVGRALDWLADTLGRRPPVRLFVANPEHWDLVAEVPVYGLPQAFGDRVIVGAQPWAARTLHEAWKRQHRR